jgi:hypothetical protein
MGTVVGANEAIDDGVDALGIEAIDDAGVVVADAALDGGSVEVSVGGLDELGLGIVSVRGRREEVVEDDELGGRGRLGESGERRKGEEERDGEESGKRGKAN